MGTTDLLLTRLERELRPLARKRIATGRLPREELTGAWVTCATARLCSLCEIPIEPEELDYEIERVGGAAQTLRFHRVCHYAWQLECERVKQRPRGDPHRSVPLSMHSSTALERILAHSADASLVVDESGTVLLANDQACQLLQYAAGELNGQRVEFLIPDRFRLAHIGHRLRFMDERRTRPMGAGLELVALCKDGSERRVDISLNPVQRGLETLIVATIRMRQAPAAPY